MSKHPTITHDERVARSTHDAYSRQTPVAIYASRKATLREDLSGIEETELLALNVVLHDGYNDAQTVRLDPRAAVEVFKQLGAALRAATGHVPEVPQP